MVIGTRLRTFFFFARCKKEFDANKMRQKEEKEKENRVPLSSISNLEELCERGASLCSRSRNSNPQQVAAANILSSFSNNSKKRVNNDKNKLNI